MDDKQLEILSVEQKQLQARVAQLEGKEETRKRADELERWKKLVPEMRKYFP